MSSQEPREGIPFTFFVSLLREISKNVVPRHAGSQKPKTRDAYPTLAIFQRWLKELRRKYDPLPARTTSVIFRLLFPEEDSRRKYGMQETKLSLALTNVLAVNKHALENWKSSKYGCLGECLSSQMFKTSPDEDRIGELSIFDVDDLLDQLAANCGFSHKSVRELVFHRNTHIDILRELFRPMPSADAGFLVQIILKDLRPMLYPLTETHFTAALLAYNSAAVQMLTFRDAMKAWDPVNDVMSKMYRVRRSLDEASKAFSLGSKADPFTPKVGLMLEIPKSTKGRSIPDALRSMGTSELFAETKYDGERAQIHVTVSSDGSSHITIYSKSTRDSTNDRLAVHGIVRAALGLPLNGISKPGSIKPRIVKDIILDAEMVAHNGTNIDEFWRIRSLINSTAHGIRRRYTAAVQVSHNSQDSSNYDPDENCSIISDIGSSQPRHLALVFFDIMYLDGVSLVHRQYSQRRSILESVIITKDGYSMLSKRIALGTIADGAENNLRRAFAESKANKLEGLIIKASHSRYNDYLHSWVKLKSDYIPGLGDMLDLVVLGIGWDPDRGRGLRVGPETYTTFYVGAITNLEQTKQNANILPDFHIYFVAEWGMTRVQLEEINGWIRSIETVPYESPNKKLAYTYTMFEGLPNPKKLLVEPVLAEVFGAGFDKERGSKHYALRHPRLEKLHRTSERSWKDCVSLKRLHEIALECVGRESTQSVIDQQVANMFRPVSKTAKDAEATAKWQKEADQWEEILLAQQNQTRGKATRNKAHVDKTANTTKPKVADVTNVMPGIASGTARYAHWLRTPVPAATRVGDNFQARRAQVEELGAVADTTNTTSSLATSFDSKPSSKRKGILGQFSAAPVSVAVKSIKKLPKTFSRSPKGSSVDLPPTANVSTPRAPQQFNAGINFPIIVDSKSQERKSPYIGQKPSRKRKASQSPGDFSMSPEIILTPANKITIQERAPELMNAPRKRQRQSPRRLSSDLLPLNVPAKSIIADAILNKPRPTISSFSHPTALASLLSTSLIHFAGPRQNGKTQPGRPRNPSLVSRDNRVHDMDSLLFGCGWNNIGKTCSWAQNGIVFLDDTGGEGQARKSSVLKYLESVEKMYRDLPGRLPIWLFDSKILSMDEALKTRYDLEDRAICRIGL